MWRDKLPPDVAEQQDLWEKAMVVLRLIRAGTTYEEAGRALNLTRERIRQLEAKAKRVEKRPHFGCPATNYLRIRMAQEKADAQALRLYRAEEKRNGSVPK